MKRFTLLIMALASTTALAGYTIAPVSSGVAIDGALDSGEGYTTLTENTYGRLAPGGSTVYSDLDTIETASYHWWDGGADHGFSTGPRGNLQDVRVAYDINNLYIGIVAGTAPFNSWSDTGGDNDQGDLFIAIDAADGTASGNLSSDAGFNGFGLDTSGHKAVDFESWTPTHILGVQYVDNGGGGGGYAMLERMSDHDEVHEAQSQNDGGFDWAAAAGSTDAQYEFMIPWSMLGIADPFSINDFRLNAYMTQNGAGWDVYDSAYGYGQGEGQFYEEMGDHPLDPDDSGDFLGAGDAGQYGVPFGSFPGSNFVGTDGSVDHSDGIDSIGGYLAFGTTVPEPSTVTLLLIGVGIVTRRLRRRK
ncbi:MAG: PEP-CTERM sorting domain-containing protein [Verrucomicrobia bacterium]|nr:PEP-CTERM sorting domain-containing protein [Verrucomicrobiota bacterium]